MRKRREAAGRTVIVFDHRFKNGTGEVQRAQQVGVNGVPQCGVRCANLAEKKRKATNENEERKEETKREKTSKLSLTTPAQLTRMLTGPSRSSIFTGENIAEGQDEAPKREERVRV
jgi:hypothetical protein